MSSILNEKKKSTDETNFVKDFLKLEVNGYSAKDRISS